MGHGDERFALAVYPEAQCTGCGLGIGVFYRATETYRAAEFGGSVGGAELGRSGVVSKLHVRPLGYKQYPASVQDRGVVFI